MRSSLRVRTYWRTVCTNWKCVYEENAELARGKAYGFACLACGSPTVVEFLSEYKR